MSEQGAPAALSKRFLAVRCSEHTYAVPVDRVAEIVRVPEMAKVPQAPAALCGLANLRGSIVPIADLSRLLRLASEPLSDSARAVVIDAPAPYALLVNTVEGIVNVQASRIEQRHSLKGAAVSSGDDSVFSNDGEAVRILNVDTLLEGAFTPQARDRVTGRSRTLVPDMSAIGAVGREMLATFVVDGQDYAFPFAVVQEVFNIPRGLTSLPGADAQVPGLISFRDGLLPILSLRALFGLANELQGNEKVIVAYVRGTAVGVVVDAVKQSIAIDPLRLEPVPPIMAARIGGEAKVKAIYRSEADSRLLSVLHPDLLLSEETMRGLGHVQAPARDGSASTEGSKRDEIKLLAFQLGAGEFALPIEAVEEVALVPESVTRVPKTPKFLEGVINLRGEVLPVIDQRKRFDMPPLENRGRTRLIVVKSGSHRAGIIVDSVSEVLGVDASALARAPDLAGETTRLIQSIVSLDEGVRILMLLDPTELLTRAERTFLDSFQTKLQT
ncbi:chemotaxis protein CheW [Mesorhizobium sp. M0757]|uniref:chemotaxis protein CheW n=1 Tax=unclassified Mesorhizobium TaxID=325217 RepID=UPI00333AB4F6